MRINTSTSTLRCALRRATSDNYSASTLQKCRLSTATGGNNSTEQLLLLIIALTVLIRVGLVKQQAVKSLVAEEGPLAFRVLKGEKRHIFVTGGATGHPLYRPCG